ncbi:MAG: GAF domain-containing protein [candidate division Zixibacteria bacterium]|nr:GAF domain-containing protein [candidate division Zixibacteria bacterium]
MQRSIKTQKAFRDFVAVILKTVRSEGDLHTRVIRLAKLLEQYVKFKTVSVYIWSNGSPQILDFNLPSGNNVFIEKGYLKGAKYEPIRWVLKNKRSLTLPDDARFLELDNQVQIDSRLLYMPVVVNGQAVGVISIAAIEPSYRFSQNDMIAADAIASVISGTILEEMNKTMADESFDRIGTIKYSIEAITDKDQSDQIYRELAKILVNKTPATFCRIMLLNEERDRFRTKAIYQRRELLWDERTITGLPVSELYSHRKVISTGKPLVINDVDSNLKISELEAKLLLPKGISQCMINPIIIDGKTIGVVTVGESRKPDRNQFGSQQIIFALLLTNVISVAFQQQDYDVRSKALVDSNRVTARRLVDFENQVDTLKIVGGFNSRINGPLAGILASCEYILSRQDIKREEMDRYINIINKNASKIHRLTNRLAEAKRAIETIVES